MSKNIEISLDDLMRVCNTLDSLRVSLDQIGAVNLQGHDKMLMALDEYFTPQVYREIADIWVVLAKMLEREVGHQDFLDRCKEKKIPYYQRKKY